LTFPSDIGGALRLGIVIAVLGLPVGVAWRVGRGTAAPVAGLLIAVGALIGLNHVAVGPTQPDALPSAVAVGVSILAVAGLISTTSRAPALVVVVAAAGAFEIATGGLPPVTWLRTLVVVVVPVAGMAMASFDRRWNNAGAGPVLFSLSIAGVYVTVPETLHVSVVLGVAAPVAVLGVSRLTGLGSAGAYALAGLFAWSAAIDGAARPSSIVGALGCLGLLFIDPVARRLAGGRAPWDAVPGRWLLLVLVTIHAPLVALASRVAGMVRTVGVATVIVMAASGLALLVVVGAARAIATTPGRSKRRVGDEAGVVGDRL
jgi:hypothetical protein